MDDTFNVEATDLIDDECMDRFGDLIRLQNARDAMVRYGPSPKRVWDGSAAARHFEEHGHPMTFGCCRVAA